MQWILLRHIILFIWTAFGFKFIQRIPAGNHLEPIKWFNIDVIHFVVGVLYIYTNLALVSQIIITLLYRVIRGKALTQNKWLRRHNTYGICILTLLEMWLSYTIKNYRLLQLKTKEKLFRQYRVKANQLNQKIESLMQTAKALDQEYDWIHANYVHDAKVYNQKAESFAQDYNLMKEDYERNFTQLTQAYNALVTKKDTLEQEYTPLKKEYDKLQQENDVLQRKSNAVRVKCLQEKLTKLVQEHKAVIYKLNESEQEFSRLAIYRKTIQTKLEQIRQQLQPQANELNERVVQLDQKMSLKQEAEKLRRNARALFQERDKLIAKGKQIDQELKNSTLY